MIVFSYLEISQALAFYSKNFLFLICLMSSTGSVVFSILFVCLFYVYVCVVLSTRIQDCGHDIGIASAIFLTQHELGSIEIRLSFSAGRVVKMKLHLALRTERKQTSRV